MRSLIRSSLGLNFLDELIYIYAGITFNCQSRFEKKKKKRRRKVTIVP